MPWTAVLIGIVSLVVAAVAKVAHDWLATRKIKVVETPEQLEDWFWKLIEWIFGAVERGHTTVATGYRAMLAGSSHTQPGQLAVTMYHQGLEEAGLTLWHERVHNDREDLARAFPIPGPVRQRLMQNIGDDQVRAALQKLAVDNPSLDPLALEPFKLEATDEEEARLIRATRGLGGLFDPGEKPSEG
jgi:hypothetical protein